MIRLIVEGKEIDLFKDEVFAISKAVSKIGQIDLRFGDVSIGFNVPLTAKNNEIFRYLSNLNHDNIGAFKRFEGEIRQNDALLSAGYFQVLSTNQTKKEIKVRFFGGNSDWFDLIKDRFINERYEKTIGDANSTTYDLSYLDHNFEEDVIIGSKDNEEGYIYFPCDNGGNSNRTNNSLTRNDFQVGIYEHTIFEKIFQSVGIKTKGNLFNESLFYNTVINNPYDISLFDLENNTKTFRTNGDKTISKGTYSPIDFPLSDYDPQWDGNTFTSDGSISNFNVKIRYQAERGTFYAGQYGDLEIKCEYTINGVAQTDIETILVEEYSRSSGDGFLVTFEEIDFSFANVKDADTFTFSVRNINQTTPPFDGFWSSRKSVYYPNGIPSSFGNSITINSSVFYQIIGATRPYNINDVVPKLKQSDFVKEIMFRYGVVSTYDSKKRVLTLNKFEALNDNKRNAINYTNKIDLSKDVNVDFTKVIQNYYKTSFLRYLEDDKDLQLRAFKFGSANGLGDGVLEIDNNNLSDEGDIFTSKYSATKDAETFPLYLSNSKFYLPYIPFLNSVGDSVDIQPRVLIAVRDLKVSSFSNSYNNISVGSTSNVQNIGYAYFAKRSSFDLNLLSNELDSYTSTLAFQNYRDRGLLYIGNALLDKNFNLYKRILNNPISLPIYLNLNERDLQDYDPLTPVYLDFSLDSGYYYLEEISQYKGDGSTTKCNLVKI